MAFMRLLLDHNVPDSVAVVFSEHGHEVHLVRDLLPTDSPDPLIATVSEEEGWVLVSCDKDFKVIAPRIPLGQRTRFRKLSRISLDCNEPQAASRLELFMHQIEIEFEAAMSSSDARMFVVIQNSGFKINR